MQRKSRFYTPAEWAPHVACCLAWPHNSDWGAYLPDAEKEFIDFAKNVAQFQGKANEKLYLLAHSEESASKATATFQGLNVEVLRQNFGDIWLRDTGPIWSWDFEDKRAVAHSFVFNGWGDKYLYPGDAEVGMKLAQDLGQQIRRWDWVLEGGSLDGNGEGHCLTTEQCMLNPNRNPGLSRRKIEDLLVQSLGYEKIVWLKDGLRNDHTDGHIDTLARFSSAQDVLCMIPTEKNDPNSKALLQIRNDLKTAGYNLLEVPSPGTVLNRNGDLLPASYMNFYISNKAVLVPIYGSKHDDAAIAAIAKAFPDRPTVGLMAKNILSGGGAFHCISQQIPSFEGVHE
jgi:agmatine deiminase